MTKMDLNLKADWISRKYRTAWILTWLMLVLYAIPRVASFALGLHGEAAFIMLSEQGFLSFLLIIWGAYFGANVTEQHKSFVSKKSPLSRPDELADEVVEDIGDDRGGQPEGSDNP